MDVRRPNSPNGRNPTRFPLSNPNEAVPSQSPPSLEPWRPQVKHTTDRPSGMMARRILPQTSHPRHRPLEEADGTRLCAPNAPSPIPMAADAARRDYAPNPQRFLTSLELLNALVEADGKVFDNRRWVTQFAAGARRAELRRTDLLPIWFIVTAECVVLVDLNGTAQHRNYTTLRSLMTAAAAAALDGVVCTLHDAMRTGHMRLPQTKAEAQTMSIPIGTDVHFGVPIAVLFRHPEMRLSIVRDICQIFFPSLLQDAYPNGVAIRGEWNPSLLHSPNHLTLSASVREAIRTHMPTNRPSFNTLQPNTLQPNTSQSVLSVTPAPKATTSPWSGNGTSSHFMSWLTPSNPNDAPNPSCHKVCHGILLHTPRGPLELVVSPPSANVTTADVKAALLRSVLGRSLRLQREALQLQYTASTAPLEEAEVVNAHYAVLRLRTKPRQT